MNNLKHIQQLHRLHGMIKLQATGSPREMARRMHISERQLYHLLEQLRDMEAPIRFNRRANTYLYTGDFELLVNISVQVIKGEQLVNIRAGKNNLGFSAWLQGLCSERIYLRHVMTD